jgi:hypothetical protein
LSVVAIVCALCKNYFRGAFGIHYVCPVWRAGHHGHRLAIRVEGNLMDNFTIAVRSFYACLEGCY